MTLYEATHVDTKPWEWDVPEDDEPEWAWPGDDYEKLMQRWEDEDCQQKGESY